MLSWTGKKLDAYKFDGVAESDNTGREGPFPTIWGRLGLINVVATNKRRMSEAPF